MDSSQVEVGQQEWKVPFLAYVAATLGLVLLVRSLLRSQVPENIPPFPARGYPVLGHLIYLKNGMRKQLTNWAKTTGDIYSVYFGPRLVVVINSTEIAQEAFIKNADTMSDRPEGRGINPLSPEAGITTSSGHLWKEQRTVTLHILRQFGMGKNMLAEKVAEEVSAYLDALSKLNGEASDVQILTSTAVSNVICSIIVGRRFEFGDEYFTRFLHLMDELTRLVTSGSMFNIFPWLRFLPGDLFKAKLRIKSFDDVTTYFCTHFLEKTKKEYNENNLDNLIAAYLYEMKKKEGQDTTLDEKNLTRVIFNLFSAGSETTSTTILWFMLYMLHFPHIQAKIFEEIKDVVGTERTPTMQDRPKLNYTSAAIMETQRLASIVPVILPHKCTKATLINGYTIPAGATVLLNLDAIFHNKDIWENPMEFRPERFLTDDGNLTQPEQWIPFSLGRRVCLGESLAKMELFLFLSSLVQRFELQPAVPDQIPPREYLEGITNPPKNFEIRFKDRRGL